MKNLKFILVASLVSVALSAAYGHAEDKTMAWVEGGAALEGPKKAPSVAVGFRLGRAGFVFGLGGAMDFESEEVLDAAPMDPAPLMGITSKPLGLKTVGPGFGWDLVIFWDLCSRFSLYAGPGMYFQEVRKVYEITGITHPASSDWHVGGHYNKDYKQYALTLEGTAGMHLKLAQFESSSLMLIANYHTMRGVSGGLGMTF